MNSDLVESTDEVVRNILRLHDFGTGSSTERRFHNGRIKNGKRFIAYVDGAAAIFCPSKFAGYRDNGLGHAKLLGERHGSTTSSRITSLLSKPLEPGDRGYKITDKQFLSYCASFGIAPTRWDTPRTYWVIETDQQREPRGGTTSSREYTEGALTTVLSNRYERDTKARQACIDHYGCRCSVCDMEFAETYGEIGRGFIHVHHLALVSRAKRPYVVDPINDLRPVCPNCHAMLHFGRSDPIPVDELRRRMSR